MLYCIGESSEEQERWKEVLKEQITVGLEGVDKSLVTIAYEPIWAIGPGKIPPDKDYITTVSYTHLFSGKWMLLTNLAERALWNLQLGSVPERRIRL